jgi:hypothetical protein
MATIFPNTGRAWLAFLHDVMMAAVRIASLDLLG